jgi:hypothetical protein
MKKLLLIAVTATCLLGAAAPDSKAGVSVGIGVGFPIGYPYPYYGCGYYPYAYAPGPFFAPPVFSSVFVRRPFVVRRPPVVIVRRHPWRG